MIKVPAFRSTGLLALAAAAAFIALVPATSAEAQRWRDGGDYRYDGYHRGGFRCVAEARRLGGDGPPIPGIRGRAFGRGACGEALSECNFELNRYRRQTGDAPYARCIIVRRG